jgi:lysophospholipase
VSALERSVRAADGAELHLRRWEGAGADRDLLLVHGLGDHLGRFEHVAAAANARGWDVQGVDLRGHGRSSGRRGHVEAWSDFHADLDAAAAGLREPFDLLGHSMGGLVALDWLRERQARVRSVVLSSPLLGVAVQAPRWKVALGRVLARVAPRVPLSNEFDARQVCGDPEVVRCYTEDPLVFATITPRWYVEMEAALARVQAAAADFRLPLYLNLAGEELIVSNPAALDFAERWGGSVERRIWDGLRHETMNERSHPDVLAGVFDWLAAR